MVGITVHGKTQKNMVIVKYFFNSKHFILIVGSKLTLPPELDFLMSAHGCCRKPGIIVDKILNMDIFFKNPSLRFGMHFF